MDIKDDVVFTCCSIWGKFDVSNMKIYETDHWVVSVRHKQITLGSVVFILKRHIEAFRELHPEELASLQQALAWFERATINLFQSEHFNYLGLMMKDKHLHIHGIPRYSSPRKFMDIEWLDQAYPKSVSMKCDLTSIDVLSQIRDAMITAK